MPFTVVTWNINSVRLRADIVGRLLQEEKPDVLCLQELKSPTDLVPASEFAELGYPHAAVIGQKSYNGVAIFSRIPIAEEECRDVLGNGEARHVAVRLENGVVVENFYVPAGGDVPDRDENPKFADKLDFLDAMADWCGPREFRRTILVGDLNVAPLENDVWSHKQLLKVVSHTPVEVERVNRIAESGPWVDVVRKGIPEGKLYSWWSYRARDWSASDRGRRLDHIWATPDLAESSGRPRILRSVRGWPRPSDHAPVFAEFRI